MLNEWWSGPDRKPLVLRGARQTGKSSSVREFSKQFDLFIELNLERHEDLALVRSCSSAQDLLTAVQVRDNLGGFPERTLLFLDEVQESPEAIQWLRFLKEDFSELAVVAAGSLMEVCLQGRGFSFPVGRVTFRTLYPFTFFEFLHAQGKHVLAETLLETAGSGRAPQASVHEQAIGLLRDYLLVGGMPEAVSRWAESANPARVRRIHADLVQALAEDIHKYRGVKDLSYLEAAFENLKFHYGTRFKYENFAAGYRSQLMKSALTKLEAALLIARVWPTSSLCVPIKIRPKSAPKLLPLDIGVALYTMGTGFDTLRTIAPDRLLDGRLAEIFVGQQFLASRSGRQERLHFWVTESTKGSAEVDYLLPGPGRPVPVEVKAGTSGSLKSLHQFMFKAGLDTGFRFCAGPFTDTRQEVSMKGGKLHYRLVSLPLYLAETIWNFI